MRENLPDNYNDPVTENRSVSILVVCIGNELIADDAIGHEVYLLLSAMNLPDNVRIEFSGVGGLAILDLLTGSENMLVVVDAVQFGEPPGTLHCLSWDNIPSFRNPSISVHGIGIRETIDIGKTLYPELIPESIILVGIEGRCFNRMRDFMTPETEAAAVRAAEYIRNILETACKKTEILPKERGLIK